MPTIPAGTAPRDVRPFFDRLRSAWSAFQGNNPLGEAMRNNEPGTGLNTPPVPGQQPAPVARDPMQAELPPGQVANPGGYPYNQIIGQRAFGPLSPLQPRYDPSSPEGTGPRRSEYPYGANIIYTPRGEYPGLTPFDQLRSLAAIYDVASMCIGARVEQFQGMRHAVVARDKREQRALQDECDAAEKFLSKPDGLTHWGSWIAAAVREHLEIDALTLFPRLDRGGNLYSLELVDGSTIKPIIDDRGRTVAYQQVLYGYPFSDYRHPEADKPDEQFPTYSCNELMYLPRFTSTRTPYGSPPTEWIILRINQALRKQTFDLSYYTEGNIPPMLVTLADNTMSPEQTQNFEDWFNSILAGDDAARNRIKFLPWGATIHDLKQFSFQTELDFWMLKVTCAAYSIPPQELGFTEDVNRATAELQEAVNERRGLKPLTYWFKSIFDDLIQNWMGAPRDALRASPSVSRPGQPTRRLERPFSKLEWMPSFGDKVDDAVVASTDSTYVSMGAITPQEVRAMRFADELEAGESGSDKPQPLSTSGGYPRQQLGPGMTGQPTQEEQGGGWGRNGGARPDPAGGSDPAQQVQSEDAAGDNPAVQSELKAAMAQVRKAAGRLRRQKVDVY